MHHYLYVVPVYVPQYAVVVDGGGGGERWTEASRLLPPASGGINTVHLPFPGDCSDTTTICLGDD